MPAIKPLPRMPLPAAPISRPIEKSRKRSQLRNVYRLVCVLAVFGVLAFGAVAREANIVASNRTLRELGAEVADLEARNASLRMEVARLGSTAHIELAARERLGMRAPTALQVVTLGASGGN